MKCLKIFIIFNDFKRFVLNCILTIFPVCNFFPLQCFLYLLFEFLLIMSFSSILLLSCPRWHYHYIALWPFKYVFSYHKAILVCNSCFPSLSFIFFLMRTTSSLSSHISFIILLMFFFLISFCVIILMCVILIFAEKKCKNAPSIIM